MKAPAQELDSTSSSPASVKVKSEPVQKIHAKKKLSSSKGAQGGVACHRCGNPDHLATTYRFKDKVCHKCKRRGHLTNMCGSVGACHHPSRDLSPRDPLRDKLVRSHNMFTLWSKNRCSTTPHLGTYLTRSL